MEIFVVNLKRSVKRRKVISRQLDRLGLPYRIFEATDGAALSPEEIQAYRSDSPEAMNMSLPQLGCALSHQRIYQTIVAEGIESALILEDDLVLGSELPVLLPALERELTQDELIMLYFVPGRECQITMAGKTPLPGGRHLCYPMSMGNVLSSTAYVVHHHTAKALLEVGLPVRGCADWWGSFHAWGALGRLRVVHPSPIQLCMDFPSEIGLGRVQHPVLRWFLDAVTQYDIFPFNKLLALNRMRVMSKLQRMCTVTDQPSPVAAYGAQPATTLASSSKPGKDL